jgi:hypothetical protein
MNVMTRAFAVGFEEWLRRYNADPEGFAKEYGEPAEYGTGCAEYFTKLLDELSGGKPWLTIGQTAEDLQKLQELREPKGSENVRKTIRDVKRPAPDMPPPPSGEPSGSE